MMRTSTAALLALALLAGALDAEAQGKKIANMSRGDEPFLVEPEGNLHTSCAENVWLLSNGSSVLDCSPVSWLATGPCGGANGGALTVNASGEVVCSDDDAGSNERTVTVNLDPSHPTTDWIVYRMERAATLVGIDCLSEATSVVLTLRECGSDGTACNDSEAAMTCGTTLTSEAGGIDDAALDAGDVLRVVRGTVTGSPAQVAMFITFQVED